MLLVDRLLVLTFGVRFSLASNRNLARLHADLKLFRLKPGTSARIVRPSSDSASQRERDAVVPTRPEASFQGRVRRPDPCFQRFRKRDARSTHGVLVGADEIGGWDELGRYRRGLFPGVHRRCWLCHDPPPFLGMVFVRLFVTSFKDSAPSPLQLQYSPQRARRRIGA